MSGFGGSPIFPDKQRRDGKQAGRCRVYGYDHAMHLRSAHNLQPKK